MEHSYFLQQHHDSSQALCIGSYARHGSLTGITFPHAKAQACLENDSRLFASNVEEPLHSVQVAAGKGVGPQISNRSKSMPLHSSWADSGTHSELTHQLDMQAALGVTRWSATPAAFMCFMCNGQPGDLPPIYVLIKQARAAQVGSLLAWQQPRLGLSIKPRTRPWPDTPHAARQPL